MTATLTLVHSGPRCAATLADALAAEDHAEDTGRVDPLDRLTCRVHGRWIHECCHAEPHVSRVTGHRWCRRCECELEVAVDHLTRTVTVHCPGCHRGPTTRADAQLVAACTASLAAANASGKRAALAA